MRWYCQIRFALGRFRHFHVRPFARVKTSIRSLKRLSVSPLRLQARESSPKKIGKTLTLSLVVLFLFDWFYLNESPPNCLQFNNAACFLLFQRLIAFLRPRFIDTNFKRRPSCTNQKVFAAPMRVLQPELFLYSRMTIYETQPAGCFILAMALGISTPSGLQTCLDL